MEGGIKGAKRANTRARVSRFYRGDGAHTLHTICSSDCMHRSFTHREQGKCGVNFFIKKKAVQEVSTLLSDGWKPYIWSLQAGMHTEARAS